MSALQAEIIRDEAALAALEPAWRSLWRRCPAATPFQSPAWLRPWWAVFHPGALATVAVWDGPVLVALAPLYRENGPDGGRLLPVGISLSDFCDVLLDPACPDAAGALGAATARIGLPVQWVDLAPDAAGWSVATPPGWSNESGPGESCPALDLDRDRSTDDCGLPRSIPATRRRKTRMARHRAERRGPMLFEDADALGPSAFLDALAQLHGARWRSRGEAGVLDDATVREFHARALPLMLAEGLAETALLRIGGAIAGAYYGFQDERRSYAYVGGFDPVFAHESPGAILLGRAIGRASGRGAASFSFLRGQEAYKYDWGAVDQPNSWRRVSPPHG
ncbi:glycosyl transferase [Alsobacter metallidurans]|uniref:Glycosyl transferase n=1 Tax=Alsobacter metallidurans TaxID=340221 RepID=A0A917IBN7_9HYPH|nr:GNAT family N-acetyltransferase [Alsobacter metallidurans]GGH32635.1 glycosyl transferase [Alsobacter metallidurans]